MRETIVSRYGAARPRSGSDMSKLPGGRATDSPLGPGRDQEIYVADLRIDLDGRDVFRGRDRLTLEPQAWAVLMCLLERPGEVV